MQTQEGTRMARDRGTPQGGVVSPLLANLFLHYALDAWMRRELRSVRFCRYADDGVIHCHSEAQARLVLRRLWERLRECGLELHPEKTKIIYCRVCQSNRNLSEYPVHVFRLHISIPKGCRQVWPYLRGFFSGSQPRRSFCHAANRAQMARPAHE